MTIHECKVYSPSGKLKKTHTAEEMEKHFWREFSQETKEARKKKKAVYKFNCKYCDKEASSPSPRSDTCKAKECRKKMSADEWILRKKRLGKK